MHRYTVEMEFHGKKSLKWMSDISFWGDLKIIFQTVRTVLKHEGISSETSATMEEFIGIQDEK